MSDLNREYYLAGAAAERALAESAAHLPAAAVHRALADRYEELAVARRARPILHIVTG